MGHKVQLIPPQYVKPFVRRCKNDRNDAEAISEAAARPDMPSVPVKLAEQQAEAIVLSARELLVRQRTQLVNAVRGHAAEFCVIAAKNISQLPALLEAVAAEEAVPEAAKQMLAFLGAQVAQLDGQIAELERRMKQQHKVNPVSKLLAEVPGIGPVSALSLALTIDPGRFQSGRHFAAWLGLVPKEHSTGGRQRLAASVEPATKGYGNYWCWGQRQSSVSPSRGARAPQPGCWLCWSASRVSSRQWLWPIRWPASCGP